MYLWTVPSHPPWFPVAHSRLFRTQAAPPLESRPYEERSRSQPELPLLCSRLLLKPDSILLLVIRSSYTQLGCYRRPFPERGPWKHLVSAQKPIPQEIMESDGNQSPGDFGCLDQEFSIDSCCHLATPVTLGSLRKYRDYYCFYLT